MKEFDTDGTNNIVCPHCGYEDHYSYEAGGDEDSFRLECDACGKEMFVIRHYTISYSSEKVN